MSKAVYIALSYSDVCHILSALEDSPLQEVGDGYFDLQKKFKSYSKALLSNVETNPKNEPYKFDCLAKLEPNEPYFVVLGRDIDAAMTVHMWATLRRRQIMLGLRDDTPEEAEQITEALKCAKELEDYADARRVRKIRERMTFDDKGYPMTIDGYPIEKPKKGS
jgi:hypothetical protein